MKRALHGTVRRGKQIGSTLGFPTANIVFDKGMETPEANGVYVATVRLDGETREYLSILNQGTHPTCPEGGPTVEAFLLDYDGGALYDRGLAVRYERFLRPERAFENADALKRQLTADERAAREWAKGESMENLIETREACYAYEEEAKNAVDGVTLSVAPGSFVAVLGHNGSGKSTLAKLMNALFLPTEGKVLVCGLDTAKEEHVWDVRKHAGMVFQNPDNQIVATVVREDVAFGLENLGVPQPEMIPRIDEALRQVNMTEFAASAPHML
ncbi:MAG: ATP-binding cassette domain-containing protein, partial [Clostridia bacterium]|nr:ATP-binding cassette domain-containing protein [Clostridia bacterium]